MDRFKNTWVFKLIMHILREIIEKPLGSFAASTSFFFLFSLIPSIILISSILPLTPLTVNELLFVVDNLVPEAAAPAIASLVTRVYTFSAGKFTISLIVTLWTAGLAMCELIRAVNLAYGYKEERNYIKLRIFASLYTVFLMALMLVSLFIFVIGKNIVFSLRQKFPDAGFDSILNKQAIYLILTFVSLFFVFVLLYSKMSAKATKYSKHIVGAGFSAIFWVIFTLGFSWVIRVFNLFSGFGSLATIIITMIWIYFCMYAIIIGATFNTFLWENKSFPGEAVWKTT